MCPQEYCGRNEKSKLIVKLQKQGQGAPGREPVVSAEEQKRMMAFAYRRQEELKKLEQDEDDSYLNAAWADGSALKKRLQGMGGGVGWRPR